MKTRKPKRRKLQVWGRKDTAATLQSMADAQRAQIDAGQSADGGSLGTYKSGRRAGQPLTLRRTGRTLASIRPRAQRYEGETGPTTQAATWLQRKYRAFGLTDASLAQVQKAAARRFAENTGDA